MIKYYHIAVNNKINNFVNIYINEENIIILIIIIMKKEDIFEQNSNIREIKDIRIANYFFYLKIFIFLI